jgi:hypothetical protein
MQSQIQYDEIEVYVERHGLNDTNLPFNKKIVRYVCT